MGRSLIAAARCAALLVLLLAGLVLAVLLLSWQTQRQRGPLLRAWARALLAASGARVRTSGTPPVDGDWQLGRLVLANHISWIDVFAIGADVPLRFVAKAEIRGWPLAGWLASMAGTLYLERGRRHAVAAMNHRVRELLKSGETIAVFAEGTTTDGTTLLPFHSNLVAPALEVGCTVQPVALRYTEDGRPTTATAFDGDITLAQSLWSTLRARRLCIEVAWLDPLAPAEGQSRHEVAAAARRAIAAQLGLPA